MTAGATILVADDDRSIRTVLIQALSRLGHEVRATPEATTLWSWVSAGDGDLVITDIRMPDGNGLDLVPRIRACRPDLPVIVMTAHSTLTAAVRATERGAFEYLPKPFDINELFSTVDRAIRRRTEAAEASCNGRERTGTAALDAARSADIGTAERNPDGLNEELPLIGRSAAMQEIYRVLARLIATDMTVLITGESGTGKELIALALHRFGKRSDGPFVAINMAAIPRELIESELFGHEKGAFTGALSRQAGRFEQAAGGTLFLDEIGDMPLEAQTRLLRVLQEGEFTTVGGRGTVRSDVRIVAATHRDLMALVAQGRFREDLYYRLNVLPIRVPPLRERTEDIPDLVDHFMMAARRELGGGENMPRRMTPEALAALARYHWPGNVRELENLVRRFAVLHRDPVIDTETIQRVLGPAPDASTHEDPRTGCATDIVGLGETLPTENSESSLGAAVEAHLLRYFRAHDGGLPPAGLHERMIREVERPLLSLTLAATGGNQVKAAQVLGLNRNTLRKKIRDLGVRFGRDLT